LGKEEADLSENVDDAEHFYQGIIIQVLDAQKSELKSLKFNYSIAGLAGFV